MKAIRTWAAAMLAALSLPAAAGAYSDLWWNPRESGWGLNLVQQDETAFVTLFLYGPDGRPTWYVASDARITAHGAGGLPHFHGTLYRTEGPWHGGPFDPARVRAVAVGEIDLELHARDRMRVHYAAEGVAGVKELERQSFAAEYVAAWYASQFVLRVTVPGGGPIGVSQYHGELHLRLQDGAGYMRVDDHLGRRCEYRGSYRQAGKLISFSGDYTCTAGDSPAGRFEIEELEVSAHGLSGSLRKLGESVNERGRFAAVRY